MLNEISESIRLALSTLSHALNERDEERLSALQSFRSSIISSIDELQDRCLREISLKQPFGKEFRRLAALMKISTSLERVARYISHSAEYASKIIRSLPKELLRGLSSLVFLADKAISDAIASFSLEDIRYIELGKSVEEEIDKTFERLRESILEKSKESCSVELAVYGSLLARSLERIGDHAVEILRRSEYFLRGDLPWKY